MTDSCCLTAPKHSLFPFSGNTAGCTCYIIFAASAKIASFSFIPAFSCKTISCLLSARKKRLTNICLSAILSHEQTFVNLFFQIKIRSFSGYNRKDFFRFMYQIFGFQTYKKLLTSKAPGNGDTWNSGIFCRRTIHIRVSDIHGILLCCSKQAHCFIYRIRCGFSANPLSLSSLLHQYILQNNILPDLLRHHLLYLIRSP